MESNLEILPISQICLFYPVHGYVCCPVSSLVIFSTNNLILIDELHCIVDQVVDGVGTAGGVDAPGHIVEAGLAVLRPVVSAAVDVLQILALLILKLQTVDGER